MNRSLNSLVALTLVTCVNSTDAALTRFSPHDFGELRRWDNGGIQVLTASSGAITDGFMLQTNPQPQPGWVTETRGVADWYYSHLGDFTHYYLEVTPLWTMPLYGVPQTVDVYWDCCNNPAIDESDWSGSTEHPWYLTSVPIADISQWAVPNGIGGFAGSAYIDITNRVQALRQIDINFTLRFQINGGNDDSLAIVLRSPVVVGTNSPIPAPAAAPLLAIAGLTVRGRRRR